MKTRTPHSRTKRRLASYSRCLSFQPLEQRLVFSIPPHNPGNDSYEVYAWELINTMRENPAVFGSNLVGLYNHQVNHAYGLSSNDPVWGDIRQAVQYFDGRPSPNGSVWRFSEWANFIESQNYQLGPLALEPDLSQGAFNHDVWMTTHALAAHSLSVDDPAVDASGHVLRTMPEFGNPDYSKPDRVVLSREYNGAWGEDISSVPGNFNPMLNTYTAWQSHKITDAGFYQRVVFFDTMGYIIDWGNGAHDGEPAYGHLQNLLSSDSTENQSLSLAGSGPHNKERQYFDAIGIDYYFFQNGDGNPNDGLATSWVSTHRLAEHVPMEGGGGYAVAFAYADLNGDGFYTPGIGEGPPLSYEYGYNDNGLSLGGAIALLGTNYGVTTLDYFPDTNLSVSLAANGRTLGRQESIPIRGRNVLVTAPMSRGLYLEHSDSPTLAPDSNEPNDSSDTATYIGAFNAQQPQYPYTGVFSIDHPGDTDWYALDASSAGGVLKLDVGYASSGGAVNAKLYRRNGAGGLDLVQTLDSPGDDQLLTKSVDPGRYYLEVYGAGDTTNFYSLKVGLDWTPAAPKISSAATATFTAGTPATFTVVTTGSPSASISAGSPLPEGVTLTDNHDGTATLASTASAPAGVTRFVINADNGVATTQILTLTIAAADAGETPHQRYVNAVYRDVLGRAPDAGGLAYWAKHLDQGAAIRDVAAAIAHSDEYYASFVIKPDYLQLLDRSADDSGIKFWTAKMQHGLTDQQLEAQFVAADEFYRKAGGADLAWVDAVYKSLLGRSADGSGEKYWTGKLAHGQSRMLTAEGITGSQENNTQLINTDYFHYLGRAADPGGLAHWLREFADGKTNEDVIAGFTGADEYYQKQTRT